jgi:predicted ATPase
MGAFRIESGITDRCEIHRDRGSEVTDRPQQHETAALWGSHLLLKPREFGKPWVSGWWYGFVW